MNPQISKQKFNVPVQIETNDVLFTLRSDSLKNITEVAAWMNGSNILNGNFVPSPNFGGLFRFASNFDPAVTDHQKYRVGHLTALQRSSRASDGTPLHIRNDGPGISPMDVPDGSVQPTLEFMVFVPTAEFFRVMRINSASLDFVKAGEQGGTAASVPPGVEAADADDDGLERFLTAARRQNFLVPPRRHRSFPLLELT